MTGRFSMSNPNLQQIPARHPELGPMIRSIFIPEENTKWGSFDYSQQEPRILVHYAKLQNLEGVDEECISGEFQDVGECDEKLIDIKSRATNVRELQDEVFQ